MCDFSDFSDTHCIGDCDVSFEKFSTCNTISLEGGECINQVSLYASKETGVQAIMFNTTYGTEDLLT